jgi:hypothetical protein
MTQEGVQDAIDTLKEGKMRFKKFSLDNDTSFLKRVNVDCIPVRIKNRAEQRHLS